MAAGDGVLWPRVDSWLPSQLSFALVPPWQPCLCLRRVSAGYRRWRGKPLGGEGSPSVAEEASCWASPGKDSLHGSHMWTQRGPQAAPSRPDASPRLRPCGCRSLVLPAGGCSGGGRGQAWERSPAAGHTGSETQVFPSSNQNHDLFLPFLPKLRSARVLERRGERRGGLPPRKGEP